MYEPSTFNLVRATRPLGPQGEKQSHVPPIAYFYSA